MSIAIRVTAVAIAAGAVVLTLFWLTQRRIMYFPSHDVPMPAEVGLPGAETVTFKTADGLILHGWFVLRRSPGRRPCSSSTAMQAIDRIERTSQEARRSRARGVAVRLPRLR